MSSEIFVWFLCVTLGPSIDFTRLIVLDILFIQKRTLNERHLSNAFYRRETKSTRADEDNNNIII